MRLVSWPIESGIFVIWLLLRLSSVRSLRCTTDSGISFSPSFDRSSSCHPSAWARSIRACRFSGERDIGIEKGEL